MHEIVYLEIDNPINATKVDLGVNRTHIAEIAAKIEEISCPCNCTYVSKACCISQSGIVHETPELNLGVLAPPEANLTCSNITGQFKVKSEASRRT